MLTVNYKTMTPETARTLAEVVQKMDNAIHQINPYQLDNAIGFHITFPLSSTIQLLNKAATWK